MQCSAVQCSAVQCSAVAAAVDRRFDSTAINLSASTELYNRCASACVVCLSELSCARQQVYTVALKSGTE